MKKIISFYLNKEFLMFIVIGILNTFSGVLFSMIYSKIFNPNVAFMVGYVTSLFLSYLLNSFVTFKERLELKKFIRFVLSYIPNFVIQNLVVFVVYNKLHIDKLVAYCLAAMIGVPITFLFMKIFAFRKSRDS